ncbi:MAG: phosphotransferase [Nitrospirales bacterium]|nr:phosphotransferase [Nitrospirales bacterium]
MPFDPLLIKQTVQQTIAGHGAVSSITPLAGDASNRRYFRLQVTGGTMSSLILMELAQAEAFKASEEAVSHTCHDINELPFINILKHLSKAGVSVPSLYHYDETAGLLYLEDFGDVTLWDYCHPSGQSSHLAVYAKAIDMLVTIHLEATRMDNPDCLAFHQSFDVPLLMWEFDHFLEYGVEARRGEPIAEADAKIIRAAFQQIAELLVAQPYVFTHRDYHSRNLMVAGDMLGLVDFQDALLGPVTYDLASLLRDSYIALDDSLVETLIEQYVDGMSRGVDLAMQDRMLLTDRQAFRRLFDLTSIQRNLKAVGRFVYIDRVKHNAKFLDDIPRTLGYVQHNLKKHSELVELYETLKPYVFEWQ